MALSKPLVWASLIAKLLFGYRHAAFAPVGAASGFGRRKLLRQALNPEGSGIGASKIAMTNLTSLGSGTKNPPSANKAGRI